MLFSKKKQSTQQSDEMDRDLSSDRAGEDTVNVDMSPLEAVASRPDKYPKGIKLVLVLLSIYLAIFLVALDRTIIATALPKITDHFQSFGDTGWVCGNSYGHQLTCIDNRRWNSIMRLSYCHRLHCSSSSDECIHSILPNGYFSHLFSCSRSDRRFAAPHQARSLLFWGEQSQVSGREVSSMAP